MPRARSPATLKTLIFETCLAASLRGTESVTTTSSIAEAQIRCTAGPDRTGCVHRGVHFRRAFLQQSSGSVFTSVPAVLSTDVVYDQCFASADIADQVHHFADVNIHAGRLSTMASGESSFFAKARALSTPPASGETTVSFLKFLVLK